MVLISLSHLNTYIKYLRQFIRLYNELSPIVLYKVLKGDSIWIHLLRVPESKYLKFKLFYVEAFGRRLHAPDIKTLREMISSIAEALLYYRFLQRHDTILDIGAFLGETALWFLATKQAKKVVAVEPIPMFVTYMKSNLKALPIEVVEKAVCDEHEIILKIDGVFSRARVDGSITAKCISLEELIVKYNPTAIKMDCEGCEEILLKTPCNVLKSCREWLVEIHYDYLNEIKAKAIEEKMMKCGFYSITLYDELHGKELHKLRIAIIHFITSTMAKNMKH